MKSIHMSDDIEGNDSQTSYIKTRNIRKYSCIPQHNTLLLTTNEHNLLRIVWV